MNGFKKTALVATALSLTLGGAAFAQENVAPAKAEKQQTQTEMKVDATTGAPTAVTGAAVRAGSGAMAGWPVYGSDGVQVGTVVDAALEPDDSLKYVVFAMEDGRQVQMTAESVARISENSLEVLVPSAQIAAAAQSGYTAMTASMPEALKADPVPAVTNETQEDGMAPASN
ncbi:hypothetical protein V8J36_09170 [Frigidibacter sp. MR17.14]|uniref:hypothetical protein n=1 Tax=Frigidibacter sp. MR17.14 TaxID=3126509 RepID=UPI003012C7E8